MILVFKPRTRQSWPAATALLAKRSSSETGQVVHGGSVGCCRGQRARAANLCSYADASVCPAFTELFRGPQQPRMASRCQPVLEPIKIEINYRRGVQCEDLA